MNVRESKCSGLYCAGNEPRRDGYALIWDANMVDKIFSLSSLYSNRIMYSTTDQVISMKKGLMRLVSVTEMSIRRHDIILPIILPMQ